MDLPFDLLRIGQHFTVDLPLPLVRDAMRAFLRSNPTQGFCVRREGGATTCTRLA